MGYWLIKFIQSIYPLYLQKKNLLKNYEIEKIYFSKKNSDILISKNFSEFTKKSSRKEWFNQIIKIIFKKKYAFSNKNKYYFKKRVNLSKNFIKFIYEFLYLIMPRSFFSVICLDSNIYFPQKNKFKTNIMDNIMANLRYYFQKNSFPILLDNKNNYQDFSLKDYDLQLRKKLFSNNNSKDDFELILQECIKYSIPTDFLEGFVDIKKIFGIPKNVSKIYNIGPNLGEKPLINWIAYNIEKKKTKLFLHQVGGLYGTAQCNISEYYDLRVADKFYSWGGFYQSDKIIKKKSIYLNFLRKKIKKNKQQKNILIVCANLNHNYKDLSSRLQPSDNHIYVQNIVLLIKEIINNNLKNLKIKNYPHPVNNILINEIKKIKKNIFTDSNFYDAINDSKLVISTYNSTTFLELISINKPCLIFWDENHWPLNKESKKFFLNLKKKGIFHTKIDTLIKKILDISSNPSNWWNRKDIQSTLYNFKKNYC